MSKGEKLNELEGLGGVYSDNHRRTKVDCQRNTVLDFWFIGKHYKNIVNAFGI